jgi:hypothetical protein
MLDGVDAVPCRPVGTDGLLAARFAGVMRSRREPCTGRLALKLPVKLPTWEWFHRSRTDAGPTIPRSLQCAVTVAGVEPRLNSATV